MTITTIQRVSGATDLVPQKHDSPRILLISDVLGLVTCWQLVFWLRFENILNFADPVFYLLSALILSSLYLAEAYRPDTQINGLRAPIRIVISSFIVGIAIASLLHLTEPIGVTQTIGRRVWIPSLGLFTIWAITTRIISVGWLKIYALQNRWLLFGKDSTALNFAQDLMSRDVLDRFVVVVEDEYKAAELENRGFNCLNNINELVGKGRSNWSGVVLSSEMSLNDQQVRKLMTIRLQGIPVYRLPEFYEALWYKLPASFLQDDWFVFSEGFNLIPRSMTSRFKRLADMVASIIFLLLLSPIMALVAIAVKLESPGPVFYSQIRTGVSRIPFRVYKFRSMRQDAEKQGAQWASKSDARITKVGNFIRLTRLDELPQFWNVLKGDMSLVGPRPERPEFDVKLAEAIPYYDVRYLVKPGITGWAQVMYPYGASVEDAYEKLSYDLYYIKNYSVWLDIAIVFKTVRVVLLGKGR